MAWIDPPNFCSEPQKERETQIQSQSQSQTTESTKLQIPAQRIYINITSYPIPLPLPCSTSDRFPPTRRRLELPPPLLLLPKQRHGLHRTRPPMIRISSSFQQSLFSLIRIPNQKYYSTKERAERKAGCFVDEREDKHR